MAAGPGRTEWLATEGTCRAAGHLARMGRPHLPLCSVEGNSGSLTSGAGSWGGVPTRLCSLLWTVFIYPPVPCGI